MNDKYPMMLVSIEGNIGSGKSTVLEALRIYNKNNKRLKINIEPEPIDEWTRIFDREGHFSMLGEFYKNPNSNAFAFQMFVLHTRISQYSRIRDATEPVTVIERSLLSERDIFAKTNMSSNPCAWNCYITWHSRICSEAIAKKEVYVPNLIVYLRCAPVKCLERIGMRKREEEGTIDAEYIQLLHNSHENWIEGLLSKNGDEKPRRVITIDTSNDGSGTIDKVVETILEEIDVFFTM
jgi:deoxyadenosine/deoxycytidine kinase